MFGSHLSIAGGMHNALLEAERLQFSTVQVFTKNQQQWRVPPLPELAITDWKSHTKRLNFSHTVSHASYLINLGSPDPVLWQKSVDLFAEEVARCEILGIPYLVAHPGAHMGAGEEAGIKQIAAGLDAALKKIKTKRVTVCLEGTAGQGSSIGHRLEHLAAIIDRAKDPARLGVCLDTAHLFAAGYDFRNKKYKSFAKELDATLGSDRVKVLHLNDSKKPLGSRVDRHEHIGHGTIGTEGFKALLRDDRWTDTPKILETPKGKHPTGPDWDTINVQLLQSLLR